MTTKTKPAPQTIPEFMGRKVLSVYSGRPGCCCGCRGKHTYHPLTRETGGIVRGYEVGEDECSARGVKTILRKMEEFQKAGLALDEGGSYVAYETPTRLYVIYWLPSDEEVAAQKGD